jgi:calcineurin-like phosphoesterase family protein
VNQGLRAVLTLGDNQYDTGGLQGFQSCYNPTWGRVKAITFPSPGNHDPCPSSGYDEYFGKPCWYSFEIGQWHFVSLDSNRPSDPAQLGFLEQDLANTTKRCVAAFWHHPRFSSGSTHGNQTQVGPFWTRLFNANADLVLVGHEHVYERFAPQTPAGASDPARGIRQFTVGTGGRSLYGLTSTPKPNSEVRYNGGYGVLRATLHPGSYEWRFQSEAGKTFTDSGSANCH